jgi:hypothetical protein
MDDKVTNKGSKVFFDREFHVTTTKCPDTPKEDRKYVMRIEGKIMEESESEYKISTGSFWRGYYGTSVIKYPNSNVANRYRDPLIKRHYWVDKDETTILI